MEPQWTKNISNQTLCNFFYAFFVVYSILAVISIIGFIGLFTAVKMPPGVLIAQVLQGLILVSLTSTMALFHYLICDRALKPTQ